MILVNKNKLNKFKVFLLTTTITVATIVSISYLTTFFAGTKYAYYAERGAGTIIGNWYVILGILLALFALFKYKSIKKIDLINIMVTISNIVILLVALGTGAYRLTYYYAFSRMNVWSYVFNKIYEKQNKNAVVVLKIIAFAFVVVYLLFRMSRNSSYPGFEYKFIF